MLGAFIEFPHVVFCRAGEFFIAFRAVRFFTSELGTFAIKDRVMAWKLPRPRPLDGGVPMNDNLSGGRKARA